MWTKNPFVLKVLKLRVYYNKMGPMTGRAINQGINRGLMKLLGANMQGEIIYSFIIIACSLMIYFGTKELYNLTSHKGIKYFRQSFLFFALAYFFRSFIKIILYYFEVSELMNFLPFFGSITFFIFMYFSSMAIFYLLYSVMWKKCKFKYVIYIFHFIALAIAATILIFRNQNIYLLINVLFLVFISYTFFTSYKDQKKKKSHNLYFIYFMLFVFWIFNIIDILIPTALKAYQLFIYLISSGIFLLILYKVIKKTG